MTPELIGYFSIWCIILMIVLFVGTLLYRFNVKSYNGDFEFRRMENKLKAQKLEKLAQLSAPKEGP